MRSSFPPLAVGSSLIAASLPGIDQIRGIIIDNPSGQWLYVMPARDFVPPYTLGWSRSFAQATLTISVTPGNGPAGQISTSQGDAVTIAIDSAAVGNSQGADTGASFIEQFTPLVTIFGSVFASSNLGVNQVAIVDTPGKRVRLRSGSIGYVQHAETDSLVYWNLFSTNEGEFLAQGVFGTVTKPAEFLNYPAGIDFPVGDGVSISAWPRYISCQVSYVLTYELI
jgi:hypothetical protein